MRYPTCFQLVVCFIGLFQSTQTFAQFASIKARIPSNANSIVVLDVEMIQKSPIAIKENWREKHENAFAAGLTILPPHAKQFLMAAEMDFEFMQPIWEVSLANVSYQPSLPKIAAKWNGEMDRINTRTVAKLPEDAYVVQFGKSLVGFYRPGNRQRVGRWLTETDKELDNRLSPYLKKALSYTENEKAPIIMALDLQDVVSPEAIREKLKENPLKVELDEDKLVDALSGLQGLTLAITMKNRVAGFLKVDFDQNVEFLQDASKEILLSALANNSAMIDEMEQWKTTTKGKRIQFSGPLYRSGLQRILSVLDAPAAMQDSSLAKASSTPSTSEESLQRLSSQQYYKSVSGLVDDLKAKPKRTNVKTMGQVGVWFGKYAKKIDGLPILNVDPALLDYGRYVSNSFRRAEEVMRGAGGKSRVQQLNNTGNSYSYYGNYSYGRWGTYGTYAGYQNEVRFEGAERARIRTEIRVSSAADARGIMQDVMNATVEVRRQMTEKYKSEF